MTHCAGQGSLSARVVVLLADQRKKRHPNWT